MVLVELFTKADCHLCEIAKDVITDVRMTHPFEMRETYIREGDEYNDEFKDRIPVVCINPPTGMAG